MAGEYTSHLRKNERQRHTSVMNVVAYASRISRRWEQYQVELHSRFSIERMSKMREYSTHTSLFRVVLLGILTPVPVIVIITLVGCIPLVSPAEGTDRNYASWIRLLIATNLMVAGFVNHFRCCLPSLPMTTWKLFQVSFGTTVIGVAFAYGLSVAIGFPVPFTVPVESMAGVMVLMVWLVQLWRPVLLVNEALQQDLRHQV